MYNKNKAVTAHKCTRRLRWRISVAERSYPTSKVRVEAGRTPCPRGSGQKELPHVRGQGQQPRGATPHLRPGAVAGRSYPRSKDRWLEGREEATPRSRSGGVVVRTYPSFKVRSNSCALLDRREEIPHVQGKRNPSKMVGVTRGQQRADTLKP